MGCNSVQESVEGYTPAKSESSAEMHRKADGPCMADGSGNAANSLEEGAEQALFDAAVQREIARQVREFLESEAGRTTLLREIQNIRTK